MRWEKTNDFFEIGKPISYLMIPDETLYRRYCKLRGRKCHIPPPKAGLESLLTRLFVGLKNLEQRDREMELLVHVVTHILLNQAHKGATVDQKVIDTIMLYFWKWQHLMNPAAIRPQAETADDLVQKMESLRKIFENSSGFLVRPADALSKI